MNKRPVWKTKKKKMGNLTKKVETLKVVTPLTQKGESMAEEGRWKKVDGTERNT